MSFLHRIYLANLNYGSESSPKRTLGGCKGQFDIRHYLTHDTRLQLTNLWQDSSKRARQPSSADKGPGQGVVMAWCFCESVLCKITPKDLSPSNRLGCGEPEGDFKPGWARRRRPTGRAASRIGLTHVGLLQDASCFDLLWIHMIVVLVVIRKTSCTVHADRATRPDRGAQFNHLHLSQRSLSQ